MKDEQVQRYARHLMLPDIGGLGQASLLVASARLALRDPEPTAERVAGQYLAAGGVGTLIVPEATPALRDDLSAHGPDTQVVDDGTGRDVVLAPRPAWWPGTDGDAVALAFWRGGIAATRWMAETATR
jgi:hypothetical protein